MLTTIINNIKENEFNHELLSLVTVIDSISGFFYCDNKVIYMIKNIDNIEAKSLSTTCISLHCNISIQSVCNHPTFESGYYNTIIFNSEVTCEEFHAFVSLCSSYSREYTNIKFDQFFFELSNMFQNKSEKSYKNVLGFFGELYFIKYIKQKYSLDITKFWHKKEVFQKYDFSNTKLFNCEIKTTLKEELTFTIKHNQIFNDDNVYIIAINIEENPVGDSVESLIEEILDENNYAVGINFKVALEAEKKKCHIDDMKKTFSVKNINCFNNKKMSSLINIPMCISKITYDYNFNFEENIKIEKIIKNLE